MTQDHTILQFTCVGWIIHAPQTCYWRFEARKTLLNAPGGVLSHTSNGEVQIQQMGFFLKLLGEITPTHFNFLYKVNGDTTSPFSQVLKFQRYHTPKLFLLSKMQIIPTLFLSSDIFETSSLRYHRLSYTLFSADLHFLKHILFSSAAHFYFSLSIGFSNFILGSSKWVDLRV